MHLQILTNLALLSTVSIAQTININDNEVNPLQLPRSTPDRLLLTHNLQAARAGSAYDNYQTRLAANPTFLRDLSALASASAIPTTAIPLALQDPISWWDDLSSKQPVPTSIATALPTSILLSLNSLIEPHLKANSDRDALATGTRASSVFANSAIPTTVYASFTRDPIGYINELNTASTWPLWATSLPAPLATQIGDVLNGVLSTVRAGDEGANGAVSTTPAATHTRIASGTVTGSANVIGNGKPCPTCASSCTPVTVVVTVTAIANSHSGSATSSRPIITTVSSLTNSTRAVPMFSSGGMSSSRVSAGVPGRATGAAPAFPSSHMSGRAGTAMSGRPSSTGARTTSSTVAFTGAAAPAKKVAVGLAIVLAGMGAWVNI